MKPEEGYEHRSYGHGQMFYNPELNIVTTPLTVLFDKAIFIGWDGKPSSGWYGAVDGRVPYKSMFIGNTWIPVDKGS